MAVNAFFIATIALLALGLWLLGELQFLVPYKALLFGRYATVILGYAACLFLNVFAAVYVVGKVLFLKETGRKLAHLEKQLRTGESLSEDLSERLGE